ncbi:MAG TPA: hypothetical protein VGM07_05120 [Stellaceae bacterium]
MAQLGCANNDRCPKGKVDGAKAAPFGFPRWRTVGAMAHSPEQKEARWSRMRDSRTSIEGRGGVVAAELVRDSDMPITPGEMAISNIRATWRIDLLILDD